MTENIRKDFEETRQGLEQAIQLAKQLLNQHRGNPDITQAVDKETARIINCINGIKVWYNNKQQGIPNYIAGANELIRGVADLRETLQGIEEDHRKNLIKETKAVKNSLEELTKKWEPRLDVN